MVWSIIIDGLLQRLETIECYAHASANDGVDTIKVRLQQSANVRRRFIRYGYIKISVTEH